METPILLLLSIPVLIYLAGVIFSVIMFFDCVSKDSAQFKSRFTASGEHDKLMWVLIIIAGIFFFHLGGIAYYFVEKKGSSPSRAPGHLPRLMCTGCQRLLEPDWKACPHCGRPVPDLSGPSKSSPISK